MQPTTKQAEILDAIDAHMKDKQTPPLYSWIAKRLGITIGTVSNQLKCLRKKGLVTWSDGEARSLKRL